MLSLPHLLPSITDIKRDIQARVADFKGELNACSAHTCYVLAVK